MTRTMKNLYILLFLIFGSQAIAQDYNFSDYDFTDREVEIPDEFKDKDEIVLFRDRKVEIISGENSVQQFFLLHEKILVNSDDAIEKNNRIYISSGRNEEIVVNKNRVILPDGNIITLSNEDIHEEVDAESGSSYEYYAVKGLVKGAIVEKLYITEKVPYFKGVSYWFQGSAPIIEDNLKIIYPRHLEFKYKSYNGLPEAVLSDSISDNRQMLEINAVNTKALNLEEKSANPRIHVKSFRYKLYKNIASGAKNFYNYNEFAESFYSGISVERSKKETKALKKFIKGIQPSDNIAENVLSVESLIKENIAFNAGFNQNESLEDLIESKQSNLRGLMELYYNCFKLLDIKSEFVFTVDRFERYFDLDFETTDNIDEVLLYIPEINQYLDLKNASLRSPLFNFNFGNTNALIIKEKEFGGSTMAIAKTIFIDLPGMDITTDTMIIDVNMNAIGNPLVDSKLIFGGYSGANLQLIKDYVSEDQYEDILKDISKNYTADVEIDKLEDVNAGQEFMGKEKFGLNISFDAEDLMQKTGDKYLFKMGLLIGTQSQLYQEEERQFPIEITYPHNYYRTIKMKLPEGYKISNPEVLNMDFECVMDGEQQAIFVSKYKIEGDMLIVENYEFYKIVNFPLEHFKAYQQVLNAAADFNKIVLVFEKQ